MKHGIKWKSNLGKRAGHKLLMLKTMTTQLIKHDTIETTIPKAKQMKHFCEKVVGLAKRGDLNARRQAARIVKDKDVLKRLFDEFPMRYRFRKGGYTAIYRTGRFRRGDATDLCSIYYVDSPNHKLFVEANRIPYSSIESIDSQNDDLGDFIEKKNNENVEKKSDIDIQIEQK
eukprot:TRINITY_DN938_c0_g1_i1.p1 TRINITY_DN938_c0_g1~~TRINITY_DN938_c0_g1_i1.p1  ORF type:complete len:173 (-),score=31.31 TRINITY_DN938_c0_g1_i1:53-571(-)